jgi:hypothetical protein
MVLCENHRTFGRPSLLPRFTMQDWDDIIHELQQFWWLDDIKEG